MSEPLHIDDLWGTELNCQECGAELLSNAIRIPHKAWCPECSAWYECDFDYFEDYDLHVWATSTVVDAPAPCAHHRRTC